MENNPPIFIVGPARSGTTLLCALVNQHWDIALLHEASLLGIFPQLDRPVTRDWPTRLGIWSNVFNRHGMQPETMDTTSAQTPREAALSLYHAFAEMKGKTRFGEKSPGYMTMLPDLFQMFPDARVILVWRDIEEICRSNLRRAKSNPRTYRAGKIRDLIMGYDQVQALMETPSFPRDSVFHAPYERIINDTEALMQEMCAFLDVEFDPGMTEIGSADQSFVLGRGKTPLGDRLEKKTYNDEGLIGPSLQGKLDRYTRRWAERFPQGYWHRTGKDLPDDPGDMPSAWELFGDRLLVKFQSQWRRTKRTVFTHIPPSWWQAYRTFRD